MSLSPTMQRYREAGLTPYQANLVRDVLEATVPSRRLLVAPPGLGKTAAAMALAKEIARARSGYRILIIGPRVLISMYQYHLSQSLPNATITSVTRRTFREFEDKADTGQPFWPAPFAAVIGIDTARQDDVRARLCSVTWDLAIVEEAHLFTRSRWTLLKTILSQEVFARVLLIAATLDLKGIAPLLKKVARTEWLEPDLKNWDDQPLFPVRSPKVSTVAYRRSADEVSLIRDVLSLTEELSRTPAGQLVKKSLLRQTESSPVALELTLRQLRSALVHGASERLLTGGNRSQMVPDLEGLDMNTDVDASSVTGHSPWRSKPKALASLDAVLDQLEAIERDTKREALESLLRRLERDPQSSRSHICVFCSSKATVNYLHSAALDQGVKAWLLTSDITPQRLKEELDGFRNEGGVLICTASLLQGLDLRYAQVFVHYDSPTSKGEMYIRTTRGLTGTSYILTDRSGVLPIEWKIDMPPQGSSRP